MTESTHSASALADTLVVRRRGDRAFADGAGRFELRGGATITLAADTTLDADELDSREGYGATLVDANGTAWFLRVEHADADTLDGLGLEPFVSGSDTVHLGVLESDGGDDCGIFMSFSPDVFVVATRPAGELGCPESLDDVSDWLPAIEANDELPSFRAFGAIVGSFNGITAYSNGSTAYNSGVYSTVGLTWQCVEYVNRYVYQVLSHKNLRGTGNANTYFSTAATKDLDAYTNGVSTVAPAVGDMLVSAGVAGFGQAPQRVTDNPVNVVARVGLLPPRGGAWSGSGVVGTAYALTGAEYRGAGYGPSGTEGTGGLLLHRRRSRSAR